MLRSRATSKITEVVSSDCIMRIIPGTTPVSLTVNGEGAQFSVNIPVSTFTFQIVLTKGQQVKASPLVATDYFWISYE